VNPPEGSIIIEKEDKIKEKLNTKEELAFIIVGDSINNQRPILMVDYLQMGKYENIDDLFNFLKNDSTVFFVAKEINENDLLIKQFAPLQDTTAYILSKYIKCYPYYLRERIVWMGEGKTPEIVSKTIEAIEVKK